MVREGFSGSGFRMESRVRVSGVAVFEAECGKVFLKIGGYNAGVCSEA
jgi:hypothetical protein